MRTAWTSQRRTAAAIVGTLVLAGVSVGPASASGAACVFDAPTATVTVIVGGAGSTVTFEHDLGYIRVGGSSCIDVVGEEDTYATLTNTSRIDIDASDAIGPRLTFDLTNGPFAPGAQAEEGAHDEIEFVIQGGGRNAIVHVVGQHNSEAITVGASGINLNVGTGGRGGVPDADADIYFDAQLRVVVIDAMAGIDTVSGVGGHGTGSIWSRDLHLDGGPGDDDLQGGSGTNQMTGGDGDDVVAGGADDDKFLSELGDDQWSGGSGDDYFYLGYEPDGADVLAGGGGDDRVFYEYRDSDIDIRLDLVANDGDPAANGGAGEGDLVGSDIEHFFTGSGDDLIVGDTSQEIFYSGSGHDVLRGGSGADLFYAGRGNDRVNGGPDGDEMYGQAGGDTFIADDGYGDLVRGARGTDTCQCDSFDDVTGVP